MNLVPSLLCFPAVCWGFSFFPSLFDHYWLTTFWTRTSSEDWKVFPVMCGCNDFYRWSEPGVLSFKRSLDADLNTTWVSDRFFLLWYFLLTGFLIKILVPGVFVLEKWNTLLKWTRRRLLQATGPGMKRLSVKYSCPCSFSQSLDGQSLSWLLLLSFNKTLLISVWDQYAFLLPASLIRVEVLWDIIIGPVD